MRKKKYLFLFKSEEEHTSAEESISEVNPRVSFIMENDNVYYTPKIIENKDYSKEYFTIQSLEDSNEISFSNSILYQLEESNTWSTLNSGEKLLLNTNQEVKFKINNPSILKDTGIGTFSTSNKYNVSGNIMSLLHGDDFIGKVDLTSYAYAFRNIFLSSLTLIDASNLILPATILALECYRSMFNGCTSLTKAPELPATELANYCYSYMFYGCKSLTTPPELPATTPADYCYYYMFRDCTNLYKVPELPATTLANYCYSYMFYGCKSLTTVSELPATTLDNYCYSYMFQNCTSLTAVPELPATTLANYCYSDMFNGCTSLTTVPELPATILAEGCYENMFRSCTSLTTASELPATTLSSYCYSNMFFGCSSLTKAPELPATTLADYCYYYMFQNCTGLTVAPELPSTILASNCYRSMFRGCTGLTTVPELPAATLTNNCYRNMFSECSNLSYIKILATDISASNCLSSWVSGVSSTGTFVKHVAADIPTGTSGIPEGWTVENYGEINYSKEYFTIESLENDNQVSFGSDVMCSINDGEWNELTVGNNITINEGEYIKFKGELVAQNCDGIGSFSATKQYNVKGNIMSLLYDDDFIGKTDLSSFETSAFSCLFYYSTTLIDASNLILPATTLAPSCYSHIFYGCTSLTTAPELPATTLTEGCYNSMFSGCTSLTTAPELPATTLVSSCYSYMFYGCTSLNNITMLATYINASYCLYDWVSGVADTGTFVKHFLTEIPTATSSNNYAGIPNGWTVINY